MPKDIADKTIKTQQTFNPNDLVILAKDHSQEGRHRLTREITDIFEHDLNEHEKKLAGDILLTLLKKAEADFKEILAERLSFLDHVPRSVILNLADDKISISSHILKNSLILQEKDLLTLIKSKTPEHWQFIAQRPALSHNVMDSLIDTGDVDTACTLIQNENITMPAGTVNKLTRMAIHQDRLHKPLIQRPELNNALAAQLYVVVSEELRLELQDKHALDQEVLDNAMDGILNELLHDTFGTKSVPADVRAIARKTAERETINVNMLIKALRRGQQSFFIALFSLWIDIPEDKILEVIEHQNGYGLVVICRAKGVQKSEFATLFLLSRGLRSGDKIVNQSELGRALEIFDTLKSHDAKRLLTIWRKFPDRI